MQESDVSALVLCATTILRIRAIVVRLPSARQSPHKQTPADLDGQRALCYDVGYQDAPTVLVIASDWSRGVFVWRVLV